MAKFTNKKEQVFDLQLTSYARYLMSIGKFKPAYYSFYDDNVLYDKKYANSSSANEEQNDVNTRIKDNTQYLESLVLFRDTEDTFNRSNDSSIDYYDLMEVPALRQTPAADIFKFDSAIGDAFLDGPVQTAPAWRAFALQSYIKDSAGRDTLNDTKIPQVNVEARYSKEVIQNNLFSQNNNLRDSLVGVDVFDDGNSIQLVSNDPVFYVEELNTELLTKNFDIEVFLIHSASTTKSEDQQTLERKFFRDKVNNVQNGFLVANAPYIEEVSEITKNSVEYYFDVLLDQNIDRDLACKGKSKFDKTSYYIDLDFDCDTPDDEAVFYDIYGSVLREPEICDPEPDLCQD
jgi:hypothetical protein